MPLPVVCGVPVGSATCTNSVGNVAIMQK